MKFILYIITAVLLFPIILVAQVNHIDSDGQKQGRWTKTWPNGRPMYEGMFIDDKPAGSWVRYYEGGQKQATIEYATDSDSAFAVLFDQMGRKIAEGTYIDEKRSGQWQFYTDNRKISEEEYQEGEKHGTSRTFYPTGEVLEETEWKNGQQDGNYRVFFKNGSPYMQCKFSDGKRNGLCLSYYQNGRIEMEAHYLNNLRHDEWKYYHDNGQHHYTLKYDKGKLLNPEVRDSIDNSIQNQFDKKQNPIADPEDFMQDPSEYMMRMQKFR